MKLNKSNPISFEIVNTDPTEILRISDNGDISVKGKLKENNKKLVDALRELVEQKGRI